MTPLDTIAKNSPLSPWHWSSSRPDQSDNSINDNWPIRRQYLPAAEEEQHGPAETLEVVVAVNVGLVVQGDTTEDLHSHDSVDKEDQGDEDGDPGQGLEWFQECPQEGADALVLVEKLDQTSNSKQSQKSNRGVTVGLENDTNS